MIRYKAGYKFVETGVHGEVLDFPGAMTCGGDLEAVRELLVGAIVDMAESLVLSGESLPVPNPAATDPEMDIEEPIYLHFRASSAVEEVPVGAVA